MNALMFFPSKVIEGTPADVGLTYEDVEIATSDGEALHAWWIPATTEPRLGHVLFLHGNGGNVGTRVAKAKLLASRGLDLLVVDYRGYGRSSGHPTEEGTYRDARAARQALLGRLGVDGGRIVYVGESLGGAVALELAVAEPPAALVLQSTFTSIRAMGRIHYPMIPAFVTPNAYPSLARIPALRCPLLVMHGSRDEIIPVEQGRELYAAARGPKAITILGPASHNDIALVASDAYADGIANWLRTLAAFEVP